MGLKNVGTIIATAVIIAAVGCDSDTPVDPVPDDGARKMFDIPNADENDPETTPDGRYILFVESYGQDYGYKRYLATYDLEKGEVTRLTDDGDFPGGNLAISPDGKYLAYQNTGIWILPMDDGEPFQVCDDTLADICSWKPDSTAVVYEHYTTGCQAFCLSYRSAKREGDRLLNKCLYSYTDKVTVQNHDESVRNSTRRANGERV